MQWMGSMDEFRNEPWHGGASESAAFLRKVRVAWVRSLYLDGQYDCHELLSNAIDALITRQAPVD